MVLGNTLLFVYLFVSFLKKMKLIGSKVSIETRQKSLKSYDKLSERHRKLIDLLGKSIQVKC